MRMGRLVNDLCRVMQFDGKLVTGEDVAGVDAGGDVGEIFAYAVGEDSVAEAFEFGEIVDDARSEECGAVFEGGLVDDDCRSLCLDALHHTLYGGLAEVVAV